MDHGGGGASDCICNDFRYRGKLICNGPDRLHSAIGAGPAAGKGVGTLTNEVDDDTGETTEDDVGVLEGAWPWWAGSVSAAGRGRLRLVVEPDTAPMAAHRRRRTVAVVAGENEYGDVASQIGGAYVTVYSVDSNPNTDPHTYEATPSVGQKIAKAKLLIENGVGYDDFMAKLASASPNSARKVINVQHLLGLPDSTPNPHLWYDPKTMPAVAQALASDFPRSTRPTRRPSRPTRPGSWLHCSRGSTPSPPSRPNTQGRQQRRPSRSPTIC